MYIGLIDSGIGGLSFLKGIYNEENEYILIMDKAYFPYGEKSEEFLIKRTLYLCNYLFNKGVDKIILACNTLSLVVLPKISKVYKDKVTGVIELFDEVVIDNETLFLGSNKSIMYIKKIYPNVNVLDSQILINKIENKEDYEEELEEVLSLASNYKRVILGCTHFISIKDRFYNLNYISQDNLYKK